MSKIRYIIKFRSRPNYIAYDADDATNLINSMRAEDLDDFESDFIELDMTILSEEEYNQLPEWEV